jgi:hypothetical protein
MSRGEGKGGGQVQEGSGKAAAKRRNLWRAWVEWTSRSEPPAQLALVRIAIGLVVFFDLVHTRWLGIVDPLWSPAPDGYALPSGLLGSVDAQLLWWLSAAAALAVALGAGTRVACVALVILTAHGASIAEDSESGFDQALRVVLLILALSRCNAQWSVDAVIARKLGRPPPDEVPAWPRYLLMLQLVWIYFSGGQNKSGSEWGPLGHFSALANAVADPHAGRFDPGWVAPLYPLTQIATALTMAFELGAPLYLAFLYFRATRDRPGRLRRFCNRWRLSWAWLALGVTFELGLAVVLRLGDFPWGMLALYPALLLPADLKSRS